MKLFIIFNGNLVKKFVLNVYLDENFSDQL